MKKFFSLLLLSLGIVFIASCNDDENEKKGKYESSQFEGEWCMLSGTTATDLVLTAKSLSGAVYVNVTTTPRVKDELSGSWSYTPNSEMLQMNFIYSISSLQKASYYKVINCTDYMLLLREQETGSEDTYYKVIGTQKLELGQTYDINVPNFQNADYVSSNPAIAAVNAQGRVTATGQGVAFITVSSLQGSVIVKVNVAGNVDRFVGELFSDIDAVMAAHGTPDVTGQIGQNRAIVYRQPSFASALSTIQYQYDESTREVTRILTLYAEPTDYEKDANFIKTTYINVSGNLYGLNEVLTNNPYLLSPFVDGGYYISYNNQSYYFREGHY